ncbi:D-methionine transport system permease protein metI [Anaerobiospirillum thomasii]|uniref:D-methionine transport system permease protein metI n=1 Tax=Anaerobiospirillum thomasii TaxID=179995 RepID=A0A2X0WJQ0_9GAMM|nr:methionine ABC transporter permease [Anaerobiospirillum thomasii]SPT68174.1 D-methionine transport system permease protein metI [Anaerobiospirillum thomasii]SPT70647.1 D-methionine transport system permease protein metI [Anaerobiospirillum thomasii]
MTTVFNWLNIDNQEFIKLFNLLLDGTLQTLYMVSVSSFISALIGIPLGVLLLVTSKGYFWEMPNFYRILGALVNALRSVPFIILLVAVVPLTKILVGTRIGTTAAIVPLTIGTIPFIGRLVETSLRTVSFGLIEAATSMGATPWQIVRKILLPEAMPEIIQNITITVIVVIGCSAMAGAIGGGGLGDIAIRYGYMRFRGDIMASTVIILILMVQLVQVLGDYLTRRCDHR